MDNAKIRYFYYIYKKNYAHTRKASLALTSSPLPLPILQPNFVFLKFGNLVHFFRRWQRQNKTQAPPSFLMTGLARRLSFKDYSATSIASSTAGSALASAASPIVNSTSPTLRNAPIKSM